MALVLQARPGSATLQGSATRPLRRRLATATVSARAGPSHRGRELSQPPSPSSWATLRTMSLTAVDVPRGLLLQQLQQLQQQQQQQQLLADRTQRPGEPAASAVLAGEVLLLVGLCTAVAFICSIDRAAMSVAVLPMSLQFGWDDTVKAAIASSFFAGYMVTNLCGGFLATRYSAKGVLALGVVVWSCFTIATPSAAAADGGLWELMVARGVMGLGEGVTYPSVQNLVRAAVPSGARSRALAFIYSGHQMGTIGSYVAAPLLISQYGWQSVFWVFGSLGFVWMLGWLPLLRHESKQRKELAAAGGAAAPPALRVQDVPWGRFAQNKAVWAIVAAQVTVGVGNCLAFSWLPTYYHDVFGVDVATSAAYTIAPFVVTALATNASGWIADDLVNNKVLSKTQTRKLMQAVASLGPAACLLKLAIDHGSGGQTAMDAAAMVTAWLALCGFSAAGYGSNHQDLSNKYSGILFGLCNGLASIAGSASIYATGQILHQTHDWGLVFASTSALYLMGAGVYLAWASSEEQFASE